MSQQREKRAEVLAWMAANGAGYRVAAAHFGLSANTIKYWQREARGGVDVPPQGGVDGVEDPPQGGVGTDGAGVDPPHFPPQGGVDVPPQGPPRGTTKPPDENDKLLAGTLPADPFADLVPAPEPTPEHPEAPGPPGPELDDEYYGDLVDPGAPILIKFPGSHTVYVRTQDGGYVPSDGHLVHVELETHQPLIPRYKKTDKGPRKRDLGDLIEHHGRRADALIYDLTGNTPVGYIPNSTNGGTLVLPCAQRDARIIPQHDGRIETWLKKLGGDKHEKLLDWLATLTDLQRPTAAVYLKGVKGAGKGMFAAGCARMWGASVTSYNDVLGAWNSALKSCPFVFCDEAGAELPTGSAAFRSLISEVERPLMEKFKPTATLKGAIRLVIGANNDDALRIREDLTPEDEAAIGQRILHIDVDPAAATFLEAIGGRAATVDWVVDPVTGLPGRIPRHIAWLERHRKVVPGGRFLVEGEVGTWLRMAGLRGGLKQKCLVAVARSLNGLEEGDRRAVYVKDGCVLVNPEILQRKWERLTGEKHKTPDLGELGRALAGLAVGNKKRFRIGNDRVYGWRLELDTVLEVAEMFGIGDPDRIRERVERSFGSPDAANQEQEQGQEGTWHDRY